MIGRIIGAVAGNKLAQQTRGIGGGIGVALGVIAPTILRRMSIPAMLAVAAGGYAFKKFTERKEAGAPGVSEVPKVKPPTT